MRVINLNHPLYTEDMPTQLDRHYANEIEWIRKYAQSLVPDGTKTVRVGSYTIFLTESKFFASPLVVEAKDPNFAFVINEYFRLSAESSELTKLFETAQLSCKEFPGIFMNEFLGLKLNSNDHLQLNTEAILAIKNFQRANLSSIVKLKELSVRALIRGLPVLFEFEPDNDIGSSTDTLSKERRSVQQQRGVYKSLFDK